MQGSAGRLLQWVAARHIARICVVSPHLDDASFSLATFLQWQALPPRTVATVFTQARIDSDDRHSRAMGFTDPLQEFAARREEDRVAMQMLGVSMLHAGAEVDRFDAGAAAAVAAQIARVAAIPGGIGPGLVLLPIGAGQPVSTFKRLLRRVQRLPAGCAAHAEHEWVRDALTAPLDAAQLVVGYYAEIPYVWSDSPSRLLKMATHLAGRACEAYALTAAIDAKLAVVHAYGSQVVSEFGDKEAFQRPTLSTPERLFLPV